MTVKVIYPNSDLRRIRWLDGICKAVDHDAAQNTDLFSPALRNKTRDLAARFTLELDDHRRAYAARRNAVARRRVELQNLRFMVLAARSVLHHRARIGLIEPTWLDRYKRPGEPLRVEYTKMDDWLEAARNLITGDAEAEERGVGKLLEPSRSDLTAGVTAYATARNAVDAANQQMAVHQNRINELRALVFDLHRELFAWLRAKYYNLTPAERREHLRAAGFEYVSVTPPKQPVDNTVDEAPPVETAVPADPDTEGASQKPVSPSARRVYGEIIPPSAVMMESSPSKAAPRYGRKPLERAVPPP